tara:strand:- start:309 stop:1367 length:1059 start_codon:yes stop_codon:yes gene_type:complete
MHIAKATAVCFKRIAAFRGDSHAMKNERSEPPMQSDALEADTGATQDDIVTSQVVSSGGGDDPTAQARFFTAGEAFNIKLPRVPRHQFLDECRKAFDPATATGLIPLDLSSELGLSYPATIPMVLTRYIRIRAGEQLSTHFNATGEIYYVFQGSGESRRETETIRWAAGDVFLFPGGADTIHAADDEDCVLWLVTNEPCLAFEKSNAPDPANGVVKPTHYPAARVRAELERVHGLPDADKMAGFAVVFSSVAMEKGRNILPSLSFALNSLPPHRAQRGHRHNATAITLCLQGEHCYSLIDGHRVDWVDNAVMVTPPGEDHSHHNDGDKRMLSLVIQDGGLHYYMRTMGFAYT